MPVECCRQVELSEAWFRLNGRACTPTDTGWSLHSFRRVVACTCHEQSLWHLGYGVQVGDRPVITGYIWVELQTLFCNEMETPLLKGAWSGELLGVQRHQKTTWWWTSVWYAVNRWRLCWALCWFSRLTSSSVGSWRSSSGEPAKAASNCSGWVPSDDSRVLMASLAFWILSSKKTTKVSQSFCD